MTLEQAARTRKNLGRIGALIFILFFGSVLDSCVARFREPLFTVHLLPGTSELVEGQVDHDLKELSQLRVESSHDAVQLTIDRFQPGYWLGGNMWIGAISAATAAPHGTYELLVFALDKPRKAPVAAFRAIVYPDEAALRASYLSLIRRAFDVAPGRVALALVPALALVLGLMYLLGRRMERLLAELGRAEVFMVKAAPGGYDLYFGLGRRHGVEEGMMVQVVAENDRLICDAVVRQVYEDNAVALADDRAEKLPHGAVVVRTAGAEKTE
ncbi:MAG: hypothetical protein MUC46_01395 [Desulfobacterales bacterium]|nr:hypothetical protein [Desulfobacterales bacterium]